MIQQEHLNLLVIKLLNKNLNLLKFKYLKKSLSIIKYEHDDNITLEISQNCSCRM